MGHIANSKRTYGKNRQLDLIKTHWKFRHCHGGTLRQKRRGRRARPLSTQNAVHLVFKADRSMLRRGYRSPLGFAICTSIIKKYSHRFFVKIEQQGICNDHIHLLVRFSKRSLGQHFMRVVAGQIAQQFEKNGFLNVTDTPKTQLRSKKSLWKYRVFSRVTQGYRGYVIARDYVRLNEKEARGQIKYNKQRLKGLSSSEWELLWS